MIKLLLTPQGQEYQAVCRGAKGTGVKVIPITMGNPQFKTQLAQTLAGEALDQAVLIGLGGGLSDQVQVGDWLIYQSCCDQAGTVLASDRALSMWISQKLGHQARFVKGLTCDQIITQISQKQALNLKHQADCVDMESYQMLSFAQPQTMAVVRVVSDSLQRDLPDLNFAFEQGRLVPFKLAIAMISQPYRSISLILGSLTALKRLEQCTRALVS